MTDLDLQRTLCRELEEYLLKDGIMCLRGGTFKKFNVYPQELPIKRNREKDADDENQWNYITVILSDQDVEIDERGLEPDCWKVEVHFSVGVEDTDRDRQGHANLSYLINEIYMHFRKQGILDGKYVMETEAHKRFNEHQQYPYYEGDLITYWKIPIPVTEGLEEFL